MEAKRAFEQLVVIADLHKHMESLLEHLREIATALTSKQDYSEHGIKWSNLPVKKIRVIKSNSNV